MNNDHGITGELRQWADDALMRLSAHEDVLAIADRIDAAHEEALLSARNHGYELGCEDAYEAAYQDGENAILAVLDKRGNSDVDKTMDEHGWYRALDADKKPIHLGDEVYQVEGGWVYTVKSITFYPENTTVTFECKHGFGCDNAHNVRHYHSPTVEDMLCELLDKVDDDRAGQAEIIAEYAAKLRLVGDAE